MDTGAGVSWNGVHDQRQNGKMTIYTYTHIKKALQNIKNIICSLILKYFNEILRLVTLQFIIRQNGHTHTNTKAGSSMRISCSIAEMSIIYNALILSNTRFEWYCKRSNLSVIRFPNWRKRWKLYPIRNCKRYPRKNRLHWNPDFWNLRGRFITQNLRRTTLNLI